MTETIQKLENNSEFQIGLGGDGEENILPNCSTIPALCKVGATVPMEEKTYIYKKEQDVMLAMGNDFIRKMGGKLSKSFIDKFVERGGKPTIEWLNNVIDS